MKIELRVLGHETVKRNRVLDRMGGDGKNPESSPRHCGPLARDRLLLVFVMCSRRQSLYAPLLW